MLLLLDSVDHLFQSYRGNVSFSASADSFNGLFRDDGGLDVSRRALDMGLYPLGLV
jgi:hypothetical protein